MPKGEAIEPQGPEDLCVDNMIQKFDLFEHMAGDKDQEEMNVWKVTHSMIC